MALGILIYSADKREESRLKVKKKSMKVRDIVVNILCALLVTCSPLLVEPCTWMTAAALHFSLLEVCTSVSHTEPVKRWDKFGIKHSCGLRPETFLLGFEGSGKGLFSNKFKDDEDKMFLPFLSLSVSPS